MNFRYVALAAAGLVLFTAVAVRGGSSVPVAGACPSDINVCGPATPTPSPTPFHCYPDSNAAVCHTVTPVPPTPGVHCVSTPLVRCR